MTTTNNIEKEFAAHRAGVEAGFRAMSAPPIHRSHINPNSTAQAQPEAVEAAPAPVESTDRRVLREAGIDARNIDLHSYGPANVESLTAGLCSKKELARLNEIQSALDRLAAEIDAAMKTPINPVKLAALFPAGETPPESAVAAAVAGEEGRMHRKKLAKESARRFFQEQAVPLVKDIYQRAAEVLEKAITERHKAEVEAFEKFAAVFGDDDADPYRHSPGLLRLCSRRRALLDLEIPPHSPPSLKTALGGVVSF